MNTLGFNEEGTILYSGSYDTTIRIWDLKNFNAKDPIQVLKDCKDSVSSMVINEHLIIAASIDGRIRSYDVRMGKLVTDHVMQSLTCISQSFDKNCLLLSCLDDKLRLFDTSNGELLNEYVGHTNNKYKIASCFTPDDSHIITGSEDHKLYIFDMVEAKIVHCLSSHKSAVCAVAHSSSSACMVSGSTDGVLKVWEDKLNEEKPKKPRSNVVEMYHGDDIQVRYASEDKTSDFKRF